MREAEPLTLMAINTETGRARLKFPKGRNLLPALMEEVGELTKALLQGESRERIEKEAIQVAAMAVRIIEEGCPEFDNLDAEQRQP